MGIGVGGEEAGVVVSSAGTELLPAAFWLPTSDAAHISLRGTGSHFHNVLPVGRTMISETLLKYCTICCIVSIQDLGLSVAVGCVRVRSNTKDSPNGTPPG